MVYGIVTIPCQIGEHANCAAQPAFPIGAEEAYCVCPHHYSSAQAVPPLTWSHELYPVLLQLTSGSSSLCPSCKDGTHGNCFQEEYGGDGCQCVCTG